MVCGDRSSRRDAWCEISRRRDAPVVRWWPHAVRSHHARRFSRPQPLEIDATPDGARRDRGRSAVHLWKSRASAGGFSSMTVGRVRGLVRRRRAVVGLLVLLTFGVAAAPRAHAAEPYVLHADLDYDLGSPVSPAAQNRLDLFVPRRPAPAAAAFGTAAAGGRLRPRWWLA